MTEPSHLYSGVGILVAGHKAALEHRFAGTYEGQPVEWLALCVYELADGKIHCMKRRTTGWACCNRGPRAGLKRP